MASEDVFDQEWAHKAVEAFDRAAKTYNERKGGVIRLAWGWKSKDEKHRSRGSVFNPIPQCGLLQWEGADHEVEMLPNSFNLTEICIARRIELTRAPFSVDYKKLFEFTSQNHVEATISENPANDGTVTIVSIAMRFFADEVRAGHLGYVLYRLQRAARILQNESDSE